MQTELVDRYQRATPELSRELLEELESANEAVKLTEQTEAETAKAEEGTAEIDRSVSKRLAEAKDELQRAQMVLWTQGLKAVQALRMPLANTPRSWHKSHYSITRVTGIVRSYSGRLAVQRAV
jgi:hypothetical protein